jgi:ketosteroid isomerase-like protein
MSSSRSPCRSPQPARIIIMNNNPSSEILTRTTLDTIERFNKAINEHDLDGVMALMTDECIFENTYPAPDGERYSGQSAVRGFWKDFFESSPGAQFAFEEIFAHGERAFVRWQYRWANPDGTTGHIRGVDIFHIMGGKVAEKLSYVKG